MSILQLCTILNEAFFDRVQKLENVSMFSPGSTTPPAQEVSEITTSSLADPPSSETFIKSTSLANQETLISHITKSDPVIYFTSLPTPESSISTHKDTEVDSVTSSLPLQQASQQKPSSTFSLWAQNPFHSSANLETSVYNVTTSDQVPFMTALMALTACLTTVFVIVFISVVILLCLFLHKGRSSSHITNHAVELPKGKFTYTNIIITLFH